MSTITPAAKANHFEGLVTAETAPLGVQLWPTTDDARYARNFTLESVEIITRKLRDVSGTYARAEVVWTYQNGSERHFAPGDRVLVGVYRHEDLDGADVEWTQPWATA